MVRMFIRLMTDFTDTHQYAFLRKEISKWKLSGFHLETIHLLFFFLLEYGPIERCCSNRRILSYSTD